MASINEYLEKNINLSTRVADYSQSLNQNNLGLNTLIQQLELLFALFYRSETLTKIIRDYSKNFKTEVFNFKRKFIQQEKAVKETGAKLLEFSGLLKTIDEMLVDIQANADLFINSSKSLAHLAKNAEIRSYQAREEGRGLAVIARESLSLANLAQTPFQNFEILLNNLKEIAKPVVTELGKIIKISKRSSELLSDVLNSLRTIDETIASLQKIMTSIEQHNAIYNELKKNVSTEVNILKEQLLLSLNTIDDISVHCAELSSLAQILNTLNTILESNGNPSARVFVTQQFHYMLAENARVLDRLSVGKKPPLFLHKIYSNINSIVTQIHELSQSVNELTVFGDNLNTSMNEIVSLEAQLDAFFDDISNITTILNRLGSALSDESSRIEVAVVAAGKIFSKIKTLSIFAKIEESRCVITRDVISPVIAEFAGLAMNTEKPFLNISNKLTQLKKAAQSLSREGVGGEYLRLSIPDYSKIKIFLDDIVRVLGEKSKAAAEVLRIAEELNDHNKALKELGQQYDESIDEVLRLRSSFDQMVKQNDLTVPAQLRTKTVINTALTNEPLTLRPDLVTDTNSHAVIGNISSGLFQFGEGVDIIPGLCERYTMSQDGTEYMFRIKDGLNYQNGIRLSVEGIRDGLTKALCGPNSNLFEMISGARDFIKTNRKDAVKIRIVDNYTIQVKLKFPFLPFLANFATNVADPYIDGEFPIGAGPFKIVSWERKKRLTLEANDYYYEGRPAIDEFNYLFTESDDESYELFMKGTLSIYRPSGESVLKIKRKSPELLFTTPELSVQFLGMNCSKSPFNNKLVRRAVAYAIDTKKLVKKFLEGSAIPARGIFPPSMKVHNPKLDGYQYNPQKSRELLAEAGFKNGLPDTYQLDINDSPSEIRRAELVKSLLGDIGVKVDLNPLPWRTLLEKSYKGHSILAFQGWVSDNGDPDNFLYPLFHSSSFGYPGNTFFFANQEIDRDIDEARKIRNVHQRMLFYRNIEKKILAEAPGVCLHHSLENIAIHKQILGLKPHPLGLIRLKFVYAQEKR